MIVSDKVINQRQIRIIFDHKMINKILAEAAMAISSVNLLTTAAEVHISKKDEGTRGFKNNAEICLTIPLGPKEEE